MGEEVLVGRAEVKLLQPGGLGLDIKERQLCLTPKLVPVTDLAFIVACAVRSARHVHLP